MTGLTDFLNVLFNLRVIEENLAALNDGVLNTELTDMSAVPEIDEGKAVTGGEKASAGIENIYNFLNGAGESFYAPEQEAYNINNTVFAAEALQQTISEPVSCEDTEKAFLPEKQDVAFISNLLNETFGFEPDISVLGQGMELFDNNEKVELSGDTISGELIENIEIPGMLDNPVQGLLQKTGGTSAVLEYVAGAGGGNHATEIRVDARSTNTVNSALDLDEMTDYIGEKLREAMYAAAEGVH